MHPSVTDKQSDWQLYRSILDGASTFRTNSLFKHEDESDAGFEFRKKVTYIPSFAKLALTEIKNQMAERLRDIVRTIDNPVLSMKIQGFNQGVDNRGNSLTSFIYNEILLELLAFGRVGVFVDRKPIPTESDRSVDYMHHPYIYKYTADNILNWAYNDLGYLSAVQLRENYYTEDPATGLPTTRRSRTLLLRSDGESVTVKSDGTESKIEKMSRIPFIMLELTGGGLLDSVALHDVALLNLASQDMFYTLTMNLPFYTEQYDPFSEGMSNFIKENDADGEKTEKKIETGSKKGRRYPKDMERPGFIHPSSEPMRASMEKQDAIKREIRNLVNLTINNLREKSASPGNRELDTEESQTGLSVIGNQLYRFEREYIELYHAYMGEQPSKYDIVYPSKWDLKSDELRNKEAKDSIDLVPAIPSITGKKEILKGATRSLLGQKVTEEVLLKIEKEIDSSVIIETDPKIIKDDLENTLVSLETASRARGYPEGEVEQAKKDHAERIARIREAQESAASRGAKDFDPEPTKSPKEEKKLSRDTSLDDTVTEKVRGEGK